MNGLLITSLFLTSFSIFGAEADHVTHANSPIVNSLEDASTQISEVARELVAQKLDAINSSNDCSQMPEKELYSALQEVFANHSKGALVKDILYTEKYPIVKIALDDSVYGAWSVLNGYLLGRKKASESPLALAPLIRVGDVIVGTDKLEHLFGMGFQYFDRHYLRGHSLKRVLKRGVFFEKTILGGNIIATGIFSYADLSANFNGMRFWNHMLQKRDDVLGKEYNLGPYIACENGAWKQVKEIDFSAYLDLSSDESINCSKFASRKGLKKYQSYLKESDMSCPRRMDLFNKLSAKYDIPTPGDSKKRPLSHWILNDEGNGKVNYFNEF